jgi:2-desacetyl-2-hydroxyethyl bacteriochlorophyllide A dehydrogenase
VRALHSAISQGSEMLVYRGQVPPGLPLDLPALKGSFSFPIKYGYASVGRVEETGDGVTRVSKGDLVFVHHPHQSWYTVAEEAAIRLPSKLDPEAGVFLANLETAVNVVLDARPRLGDRVIVFGQGVVGLLVTQLLRKSGVRTIIGVDAIARRRELSELLGADAVLAPGDRLVDLVRDLTEGQGADLAIEISGNPQALDTAIDCVGFQASIVVASWYGVKPATLHLGGAFHRNRLRIISSQVSNIDPALGPAWTRERRLATALTSLHELAWQPLISHRFRLEEAAKAYRLLDERPEEAVQVVFSYV